MKIVHSFWSKPSIVIDNGTNEKTFGGWRHKRYQYMSWALSCLTFKRYYPNIELVTDLAGKKILIDQLKLPYTSVKVELDCLNTYPEKLWALGKLFAYGLQNEPFIHVDNDIFIWEKFNDEIEKAQLLAQHVDDEEGHYSFAIKHLKERGMIFPSVIQTDLEIYNRFNASNAGIIGGNNIDFFKEYVKLAFEFVDANFNKIDKTLIGASYAIIYEQYLYSALAREKNIKIELFLKGKENNIINLVNFMNKYGKKKYVHLQSSSKFFFEYCRELEHQLLLEFPEYHERIIEHEKRN